MSNIPFNETICARVDFIYGELEKDIAGKRFDGIKVLDALKAIRKSANAMENSIKLRKEMMIEAKLEEVYKRKRGEKYDTGVRVNEVSFDRPQKITVIVKQKDKIIYEQEANSGVFSITERIDDINNEGVMSGKAQHFQFGNPFGMFYALDQLNQNMHSSLIKFGVSVIKIFQSVS